MIIMVNSKYQLLYVSILWLVIIDIFSFGICDSSVSIVLFSYSQHSGIPKEYDTNIDYGVQFGGIRAKEEFEPVRGVTAGFGNIIWVAAGGVNENPEIQKAILKKLHEEITLLGLCKIVLPEHLEEGIVINEDPNRKNWCINSIKSFLSGVSTDLQYKYYDYKPLKNIGIDYVIELIANPSIVVNRDKKDTLELVIMYEAMLIDTDTHRSLSYTYGAMFIPMNNTDKLTYDDIAKDNFNLMKKMVAIKGGGTVQRIVENLDLVNFVNKKKTCEPVSPKDKAGEVNVLKTSSKGGDKLYRNRRR